MQADEREIAAAAAPKAVHTRAPFCFGSPGRPLFGWLHVPTASAARARGVVVCNPIGYEYILTHRTTRHLADRLAMAGVPTLRFDYDGTGDSAGDDRDAERVRSWIDSIHAAIDELERSTGAREIVLVGIRFGATLAVLAARERPVHGLVLWATCASGKRYAREMRALAMSSSLPADGGPFPGDGGSSAGTGGLEAAGFTLSAECLDEIRAIDLLHLERPPAHRALVVAREDLQDDPRLAESLRGFGLDVEYRRLHGYVEMMDEPHFSRLPEEVIAGIEEWVERDAPVVAGEPRLSQLGATAEFAHDLPPRLCDSPGATVVRETCVRFGPERRLFGVLAEPAGAQPGSEKALTAVLLLNTGCVHHVGSNRVYVQMARHLAGLGVPSLRYDIAGIGDSPAHDPRWENHPYAPTLERDTLTAIDFLRAEHGFGRFITVGLCSGAYGAFHAALGSTDVVDAIMINPLTFHWQDGMSLKTPPHQHYADVSQYRRSAKSWSSWKKVLTGRTDLRRIVAVSMRHATRSARGYLRLVGGSGGSVAEGGDLDANLHRIAGRGGHMSFIFAEGDPGLDLLYTEARWTVRRLQRRGAMTIDLFPGADHTFTPPAARERMVDLMIQRVLRQRG